MRNANHVSNKAVAKHTMRRTRAKILEQIDSIYGDDTKKTTTTMSSEI